MSSMCTVQSQMPFNLIQWAHGFDMLHSYCVWISTGFNPIKTNNWYSYSLYTKRSPYHIRFFGACSNANTLFPKRWHSNWLKLIWAYAEFYKLHYGKCHIGECCVHVSKLLIFSPTSKMCLLNRREKLLQPIKMPRNICKCAYLIRALLLHTQMEHCQIVHICPLLHYVCIVAHRNEDRENGMSYNYEHIKTDIKLIDVTINLDFAFVQTTAPTFIV